MLTEQQHECLAGQLDGQTVREIAERLGISHQRVVQHLQQARRNLARAGLPVPPRPPRAAPPVHHVSNDRLNQLAPERIRERF